MAFAKFPPVTTGEAIALLKQDTMLLHDIVHGDDTATVLTENGVVPSIDKVIKDLTTKVDSAIQDTGWFIVGTFVAGFTFTSYNQVGRDASGELWSYNGDLPFVVNPLTVPSSPLYTQRGDAALRSELAATDSSVIIGSVEARHVGQVTDSFVTPEEFGATGDGVSDDTSSVNNWLMSGKPLALRKMATYRLTSEINMPSNPIVIIGLGRLPVYAYEFASFTQPVKLPTFLIDHNGSDAFRFKQNSSARGSYFYGFNVIRKSGALCTRAFGFDTSGSVSSGSLYGYDCTFDRLGIFDFVSAFDMYVATTTIEPTMADITIKDCVINRNSWIARNLNGTAWNMFRFVDNKAGQQIVGGLNISAHSVIEHGNLLEGMPNPVKITGAYEGANIGGSYFEANTGTALYNLQALRGPSVVNPCTILANSTATVVLAGNVSELTSAHPVLGEACYNISAPNLDGSVNSMAEIDPLSLGNSFCSQFNETVMKSPRQVKTTGLYRATTSQARGINPLDSLAMVVEELSTLVGATSKTLTFSSAAYDYVTISFMIKHNSTATPATYVTVDINGTNALGSRDYSFGDEDLHISKGDWKVYTVVVKPQVAVSSIVLRLHPYGVGASAGLSFDFSGVTVYSTNSINNVRPFINALSLNSVTATPSTGSWLVGDSLKNMNVSAGGQANFVYTSGGWVYS